MSTSTQIERDIYKVDADGKILGRLAADIAKHLMGKHKPSYEAHIDKGDEIEVVNIAKIKVTGNKFEDKMYHHHTNYPGGIRSKTMRQMFEKNPADVLIAAVSRMLPKNKQRDERLKRLKIS